MEASGLQVLLLVVSVYAYMCMYQDATNGS